MRSVFAIIVDDKERFLVGKRYDTNQSYYFLGGTYYSDEGSELDAFRQKISEKSSLLFSLEPTENSQIFMLNDGKRQFKILQGPVLDSRNQTFFIFFAYESFDKYINEWRSDFQENQIRLVNNVISKVRDIAPHISFVDWINMMVIYKNKYRSSNSFSKILKKRGLNNSQIEEIIVYLEVLDIFLRYQNLSLVEYDDLKISDGLTNSQRDALYLLTKL